MYYQTKKNPLHSSKTVFVSLQLLSIIIIITINSDCFPVQNFPIGLSNVSILCSLRYILWSLSWLKWQRWSKTEECVCLDISEILILRHFLTLKTLYKCSGIFWVMFLVVTFLTNCMMQSLGVADIFIDTAEISQLLWNYRVHWCL